MSNLTMPPWIVVLMLIIITTIIVNECSGANPTLDDYCKPKPCNTPCEYRCIVSKKCNSLLGDFEAMTDGEREHILNQHNTYRMEVANGKHSSNFLPTASNMRALSYDLECEFLAACYIQQCTFKHDDCRLDLNGKSMGQNMFTHSSTETLHADKAFFDKAMKVWFNEKDKLTDAIVTETLNGFKSGETVGHLTAMIWAKVEYVGCAKVRSNRIQPGKFVTRDFICNYKPSGNVQGAKMYERGEAASACPDGKKNAKYNGLCGDIRPISADTYVGPMPELINRDDKTMKRSRATSVLLHHLPSIITIIFVCVVQYMWLSLMNNVH